MKNEKPVLKGTLSLKYTDAELRTAKLVDTGVDAKGNKKPKAARIYLPESYGNHRVLCLLLPDETAAEIAADSDKKRRVKSAEPELD